MSASYLDIVNLGQKLFGPVISPAVASITDILEDDTEKNALFIGREGYFLRRLAREYREYRYPASTKRYHYLEASRAFLFRLMLSDERLIEFTLNHAFGGNIFTLLRDRYCFTAQELGRIDKIFFQVPVKLPENKNKILEILGRILSHYCQSTIERIKFERDIYIKYVTNLSPEGKITVVDIGFSGTIQKCISLLTSRESKGRYFFMTETFNTAPEFCPAVEGSAFWVQNGRFGGGDPLIDWSMVLEALLTAPHGQLCGVTLCPNDRLEFVHRVEETSQFWVLNSLIDGCSLHLQKLAQTGIPPENWHDYFDTRQIYESILKFDESKEMRLIREILKIDDSISGLPDLKPFTFLRGLSG